MDAWDRSLGHRFRDPLLLQRALTHRSWSAGQGDEGDWERLEFLGDALLGFVVAEWLWRRAPEATEGDLTRRKQEVVRREALERAARRLDLGSRLRLGRGEEASGGRERASLLADSFEAVVGAVYVDGGVRAARSFIVRHLRPREPDQREFLRQQVLPRQLVQRRDQLALGQVTAGAEDHDRAGRGGGHEPER